MEQASHLEQTLNAFVQAIDLFPLWMTAMAFFNFMIMMCIFGLISNTNSADRRLERIEEILEEKLAKEQNEVKNVEPETESLETPPKPRKESAFWTLKGVPFRRPKKEESDASID